MLKIGYKQSFVRQFNKLEPALQDEVVEKIEEFRDKKNHKNLRVHKLHGALKDRYSFSVNYDHRIAFRYLDNNTVVLLDIGDHDLYK